MASLRIFEPETIGNRVLFRWECTPPHPLFLRDRCTVEYPFSIEDNGFPHSMWWSVLLGCMYPAWNFLEDYTVVCEGTVSRAEREVWSRLADFERWMFKRVPGGDPVKRPFTVEAHESTARPRAVHRMARGAACCFSGGKDSLVQAGLLREMGVPTSLVNTVSARPGTHDHDSQRRSRTISYFEASAWGDMIRVWSDIRSCFDNDYPHHRATGIKFNEVADCPIYASLALPVAWYHNREYVLLASEWEISKIDRTSRSLVPHKYAMYSIPTFAGVDAVWRTLFGIGYSSLLFPLPIFCVQALLCRRYEDLLPLQDSCWRTDGVQDYCNECTKCLLTAVVLMAYRIPPDELGIDVTRLFDPRGSLMQSGYPREEYFAQMRLFDTPRHAASLIDPQWAARLFRKRGTSGYGLMQRWRAWRSFLAWRERTADPNAAHIALPKPDYFRYVPDAYKGAVREIVGQVFPDADARDFSDQLERIDEAIQYVRAPMDALHE